jgi:hypothetical protein
MASLTETAKAVLEGKSKLEEGYGSNPYPTVGNGGTSNPNPVDPSTISTGNAKTLHPGTKYKEEKKRPETGANAPGNSSFEGNVQDLGGNVPTKQGNLNLGAAAAGAVGKDASRSGQPSVPGQPRKKLGAQPNSGGGQPYGLPEEMEDDRPVVEEEKEMTIAERVKALREGRKAKQADCAMEEETLDEEEISISEELEAFINEGIEAGLSEEEILAAIDENFDFGSEEETVSEETEESVEAYQVDMSEHVNALLEGEDLSEEFQAKATTIFEAAVKAKLEEEVALLEQAYAETLEERVDEIMEQLATDVDQYLNYVVEQWISENEVAVESALRSELTEDFISGLRSLFAEHYIDVPEDQVPVVEELSSTVEELEAKLNEEIQRNVELTSMLSESRKGELVNAVCEGLTDTQAEKLKSLVENIEYTNDDHFIEKISTLRENYFPTSVKSDEVLDRVESADPKMIAESSLEGPMSRYVSALGRNLPPRVI